MPAPPIMVSEPTAPSRMLFKELPVIMLSKAFPVPVVAEPVNVRFSTLAPRVRLMLDCTVSTPSPAASIATSPALSTM